MVLAETKNLRNLGRLFLACCLSVQFLSLEKAGG